MKKLMAMLLLAGSIQGVYAQKTEKKEMFLENKSLYEELTNVQKKTDKFNLYLNMQGSFDANFRNGSTKEYSRCANFVSKPRATSTAGSPIVIASV